MGQFDLMTVATLGMEAALEDAQQASNAKDLAEAVESFEDASETYLRALRHKLELATLKETDGK